jgi:hypothetical protein
VTNQSPFSLLNSSHSSQGSRSAKTADNARLPNIVSPQMTAISSSQVSSGPASISSSHWSPGKSTDPHLYSISQPYVYSSVKPYLSTSFQTSAERGGGGSIASGSGNKLDHRNDMDQDDDDDVFGNTSHALGLLAPGEPSPPQLRRSNDSEREEGDAAGVFSFSSPYFGPRSLEQSYIPPLSPPPTDSQKRSQRLMSPGWTATSLAQLSLNGASPDGPSSSARRPPLGQPPPRQTSHLGSAAQLSALQSRSLPSNAGAAQLNDHRHQRPPPQAGSKSFHLAGVVGGNTNMLHPNSPYHRSTSSNRSRSTSRNRVSERGTPRSNMHRSFADVDDDETDEEAMVMDGQVQGEDDDATEDESEQRPSRLKAQAIRGPSRYREDMQSPARSIGTPAPLHRHPSGQPTTMSASYERANSGLNRQYNNAAASHYAMSRHHPYAISSSGASPSNVGVLSSYSPGNTRVAMARRRSSFGNGSGGAAASPQSAHSMVHQLSHSPRYANARPAVPYYDAAHHAHPGSLPYQAAGYHYGESQDSAGMRRPIYAPTSGLGRERSGDEDDEDEEDEEEEGDDDGEMGQQGHEESDLRRDMTIKRKPASSARASSHSRPAAPMASSGAGEVDSIEMNEVNAIRERLGGAANCSAFISKLWYLMCRPELYAKYIHWSESGDSVILSNDPDINNEFAAEVLPKLFKHGNNASFVRQLNVSTCRGSVRCSILIRFMQLYGFQRVPSSRLLDAAEARAAKMVVSNVNISTALQLYGPHSSFAHPRFKKDQEMLLPSMKPRSSKKTKKTANRGGDSDQEDEYGN